MRRGESGNIFLFVLLGVVLFAALMFVFTRSARQGGNSATSRQLLLKASDIETYAQSMAQAVNRAMLNGISETQLSFDNDLESGTYVNANCTASKCKVFDSAGGAGTWQGPPPGVNDGSDWLVTGANAVPDVGDDTAADLVLLLPGLKENLCAAINDSLSVTNPGGAPPVDSDGIDVTPFTGTFANLARIGTAGDLNGVHSACVQNGGSYVFYNVLMDR